jgi:hypothetical protein
MTGQSDTIIVSRSAQLAVKVWHEPWLGKG